MSTGEETTAITPLEEVTASAISTLVNETVVPIVRSIKSLGADLSAKTQVILETCFTEYTTRCYERYSKTKTILYRERPVELKKYYVRTDLESGGISIRDSTFMANLHKTKRAVISGTAGSGKSTFCKSVFIDSIEKKEGIFPVFLELRHINQENEVMLFDFITSSLSKIERSFTTKHLDYALKSGKILLILDGFDEIDVSKREKVEKDLLEISNKYHKLSIIVSSRIDSRFESWEEFQYYEIKPLDKTKAIALIKKLEYDEEVKHKFISALNERLYHSHTSFAGNPLLLTMMLLTFEQIAEIPNKMHLFYEQAFLTLFNKHDAFKSLYRRKSFSGLPIDEFKKVLSVFCAISYLKNIYSFTETTAIKLLKTAIESEQKELNPELLLRDLLENVCIMQRDGVEYTFTHRSFQEYFSAIFAANFTGKNKFEVLDRFFRSSDNELVMPMLFDMNQDLVEKEWLIPKLKKIIKDISKLKKDEYYEARITHYFFDEIFATEKGFGYLHNNERDDLITLVSTIEKMYGDKQDGCLNNIEEKPTKAESSERRKSAKEALVEIKKLKIETNSIPLNPENMPTAVLKYIKTIKAAQLPEAYFNYLNKKLTEIEPRQENKEQSLNELLFD